MAINIDDIPYKYANVKIRIPRTEYSKEDVSTYNDVIIPPEMERLLGKLVKKYPTFEFIIKVSGQPCRCKKINVADCGELLAEVRWAYSMNDYKFIIKGFRVNELMRYKQRIESKDVGRAFSKLSKILKPTTNKELFIKELDSIRSSISYIFSQKDMEIRALLRGYTSKTNIMFRMVRNLQQICKLISIPYTAEDDAKREECLDSYIAADKVNNHFQQDKGQIVIFSKNRYIVADISNSNEDEIEPITYTPDNVPSYIKRKVGLLKLAEDNTLIDGVGYKRERDIYYIMEEE